jgi:hypothetical protein
VIGIDIGVAVAFGVDGDGLNAEARRPIIISSADAGSNPDSDPDADSSRLWNGRSGTTEFDTTKSC